MKIYILWKECYDHTGVELIRAFLSKERAESDFNLVKDNSLSSNWHLTEMEIIE